MRFLHKDFEPLKQWLLNSNASIRRLEWDLNPVSGGLAVLPWTLKRRPAYPPQPAAVADIESMFQRSAQPQLAGALLGHYFHVNAPPSDVAISLPGAVEHVEAFGGRDEFVVAAHPEGGVVSVSRWPMAFQDGVEKALGWGP